jgi:hypothetical protein
MDENIPGKKAVSKYYSSSQEEDTFSPSQEEDTFSLPPPSFLHPRRNNILVAFYILPEMKKGIFHLLPFIK